MELTERALALPAPTMRDVVVNLAARDEMRTRLNLSPGQMEKLEVILKSTDERFNDARAQHNQMVRELREDHHASVREMLTPEQLPKYEQLRTEREQRAKQLKESRGR